jgi:dTDP-4-amino-4,6-dideoxygalactose transaminase
MNQVQRSVPINDLKRISNTKKDSFKDAVAAIVEGGIYLNHMNTQEFEKRLCSLLSTNDAIAVGSGTAALEIAFQSMDLPKGSRVALVANAGAYGSIALFRVGLTPIFIDVDQRDALIDLDRLEIAVEKDSLSAILITHLYGNAVDMLRVIEIAKKKKLIVIEDCAQAIGGKSNSLPLGSFGDLSTFSFYPTKNLGAIGDAGAISGNNQVFLERARSLAKYGWAEKYNISIPGGTNSRMDEIQAAFINLGFDDLEADNNRRREITNLYVTAFKDLDLNIFTKASQDCVAHLFVIELPNSNLRDNLKTYLVKNGIGCDIHYPIPDHKQIGFADWVEVQTLAITESLSDRILSLPLFPSMTDEEVQEVISTVLGFGH